jgi:hypothetical protein
VSLAAQAGISPDNMVLVTSQVAKDTQSAPPLPALVVVVSRGGGGLLTVADGGAVVGVAGGIRAWYYECENTCVYHGVSHDDWCDPAMFVCSGTLEKLSDTGIKLISSGTHPPAASTHSTPVDHTPASRGCHAHASPTPAPEHCGERRLCRIASPW